MPFHVHFSLTDTGLIEVLYTSWPKMFLMLKSTVVFDDNTENKIVIELFDGFG